jgi:hypothetical protein
MKKLFIVILVMFTGPIFAQLPTLPIDVTETVDTAEIERAASARALRNLNRPPAKGMILITAQGPNGPIGPYWAFPNRVGIGSGVSGIGVTESQLTSSQNAAQNYADLRANEARAAAIDTATILRTEISDIYQPVQKIDASSAQILQRFGVATAPDVGLNFQVGGISRFRRTGVSGLTSAAPSMFIESDASTVGGGGGIIFQGRNTASAYKAYANLLFAIEDNTAGSEDGGMFWQTMRNGLSQGAAYLSGNGNIGIGASSEFNATSLPTNRLTVSATDPIRLQGLQQQRPDSSIWLGMYQKDGVGKFVQRTFTTICPDDFGAKRDDGINDAVAFASAISHAKSIGNDIRLELAPGTYNLTEAIAIMGFSYIEVVGNGAVIDISALSTGDALKIGNVSGDGETQPDVNTLVSNVVFDFGGSTGTQNAVKLDNLKGTVKIQDCLFRNYGSNSQTGIFMRHVGDKDISGDGFGFQPGPVISNCKFTNEDVTADNTFDYNDSNAIGRGIFSQNITEFSLIEGCHFWGIGIGVELFEGANTTISNSFFLFTNANGADASQAGAVDNAGAITVRAGSANNNGKLTITGCHFKHNRGTSVFSDYASTNRPTFISNCQFIANSTQSIIFENGDGHTVTNCFFDRSNMHQYHLNSPYGELTGSGPDGLTRVGFNRPFIILINSDRVKVKGCEFTNNGSNYTVHADVNSINGSYHLNAINLALSYVILGQGWNFDNPTFDRGIITATTDANGSIVIPHTLGLTPQTVQVSYALAQAYTVVWFNHNNANFTARIYNGANTVNSTSVRVSWFVSN